MKNTNRLKSFLLIALLLFSSCGGPTRKEGDDNDGFVSSFENTIGFFELTLYAIFIEYLFNLNKSPFSNDSLEYNTSDLIIFDKYYERKRQFESLNFQIDSVFIEFCAKDQFVADSKIDSINILSGKLLIDRENPVFMGKIYCQYEFSSMKGSGEITIDSDSLDFGTHPVMPSFDRGDYNVIKFTANASYRQYYSPSMSADNAIMNAFCSIIYVGETGSSEKTKEDILLLHFVKDDDFWRFDSADRNLVELLENLDN